MILCIKTMIIVKITKLKKKKKKKKKKKENQNYLITKYKILIVNAFVIVNSY